MNTLDSFILKLKQNIPSSLNEIAIARYCYIQLGKLVTFDTNYAFGNSKAKKSIYRSIAKNINQLNSIFESKTVICKSLAYIYEYILQSFNIQSYTSAPLINDHIYNIIVTKDNILYEVDLQQDLKYVQSSSKTHYFGATSKRLEISFIADEEIKKIDQSIGYNYIDDTIDICFNHLSNTLTLSEKVEHLLDILYENVDMQSMGYLERFQFIHYQIYNQMPLIGCEKKLYFSNCYTKENGDISCLSIDSSVLSLYIILKKNYVKISENELIKMLKNGLIVHHGILALKNKHLTSTSKIKKYF